MASADWMSRNLMSRIECAFPIYDQDNQKVLEDVFNLQWNDPLKARIIDGVNDTKFKSADADANSLSSQQMSINYLSK